MKLPKSIISEISNDRKLSHPTVEEIFTCMVGLYSAPEAPTLTQERELREKWVGRTRALMQKYQIQRITDNTQE